jgi:hypothetical protein
MTHGDIRSSREAYFSHSIPLTSGAKPLIRNVRQPPRVR